MEDKFKCFAFTMGYAIQKVNNDSSLHPYDRIVWTDEVNKPTREDFDARLAEIYLAKAYEILREKRDRLLQESDIKVLPDFPHTTQSEKDAWLTYRQELRDLPENTTPMLGDFFEMDFLITNVTWPVPPS